MSQDYVTPGEHEENFVVDKADKAKAETEKNRSTSERCGNMTPRKLKEIPLTAEMKAVLGFEWLESLSSTKWDDRSGALDSMRRTLEQGETKLGEPENVFKAGAYMLSKCLPDRVLPVYLSALELGEHLVTAYATKHEIKSELVLEYTDMMMPAIVTRTSDRNVRTIEATHRTILAFAKSPSIGCRHVVTSHVLTNIANNKDYAAIKGRLQLLELMIEEFGFSKSSGLSLSAVMAYVRPQLEAADEKLRMAAVEVTVSCYFHKGERTQQYVANLKPALLKLLEARFAEVGTKKSGKDKKKQAKNNKGPGRLAPLRGLNGQRQVPGKLNSRGSSRQSTSSSDAMLSARQSTSAGSAGSLGSQKAPLGPIGGPRKMDLSSPAGQKRLDLGSPKLNSTLSWSNASEEPRHSGGLEGLELGGTMRSQELASLKGLGGDVLSPPVRHGGMAEDPMASPAMGHPWLADPTEDKAPEFIARMKGPEFIPSMPLVTPARKRGEARAMTQEEEEEDVLIQEDDGEELDFERAERLMDEIEGLY